MPQQMQKRGLLYSTVVNRRHLHTSPADMTPNSAMCNIPGEPDWFYLDLVGSKRKQEALSAVQPSCHVIAAYQQFSHLGRAMPSSSVGKHRCAQSGMNRVIPCWGILARLGKPSNPYQKKRTNTLLLYCLSTDVHS